jgi:ABC-2 type transport system permease protein
MSSWEITVKDLLVLTRDKQALVLLLVLPLILISIIGMSTGQFLTGGEDLEKIKIVVVDPVDSSTSQSLITELKAAPELQITFAKTRTAGMNVLRRGEASLIMVVGPKFEDLVDDIRMKDLFHMTEVTPEAQFLALDLSVETNGNAGVVGRLLKGVLFADVVKFIIPIAAKKNPMTRNWMRANSDDDNADGISEIPPVVAKAKIKDVTIFQWVVPGFTVMFAFFLINIMARSFMIERDQGTLRRLMMAPVDTASLLFGKTVPFYLTSILQCSLLFLCGKVLFGMPWGAQPIYLIPVILCTSAAAASLGLLLSTMVRTDQQISSYGTTLILTLSAVSGCFLPRELLPKIMKQISVFTPHAWSLKAFDAVLNQPIVDPIVIATSCGMLLLFATGFSTTGWWRFRNASHS